ncbi:MAG: hypothetical protein ABIP89_05275 [Polyangiaceae bacterium]
MNGSRGRGADQLGDPLWLTVVSHDPLLSGHLEEDPAQERELSYQLGDIEAESNPRHRVATGDLQPRRFTGRNVRAVERRSETAEIVGEGILKVRRIRAVNAQLGPETRQPAFENVVPSPTNDVCEDAPFFSLTGIRWRRRCAVVDPRLARTMGMGLLPHSVKVRIKRRFVRALAVDPPTCRSTLSRRLYLDHAELQLHIRRAATGATNVTAVRIACERAFDFEEPSALPAEHFVGGHFRFLQSLHHATVMPG